MIMMDNEIYYNFDMKLEGNILVVGRTGCVKTTFVQNLGKNKKFGKIKEVIWILKIALSKDREVNICNCFVDEHIDFKYPDSAEDIDDLLEFFQRKRENYLGENTKLERFIVMDDVSRLPDKSEAFANFLTVSRKFGLTCVYIFLTIHHTTQNWQIILPQTKIFNIFPGSVQTSYIMKILSSFVAAASTIIYQTEKFGLIGCTLKYQILTTIRKKFAIIIEKIEIKVLIPS